MATHINRLHALIDDQLKKLLGNKWYALAQVLILALLPYTSWLSMALMALITLRKGWRAGGWLLVPVLIAQFAVYKSSMSSAVALCNALLILLPCYFGAIVLRLTASWRAVAAFFFLLIFIGILLLHGLMPDFIMAQYLYLQNILREAQAQSSLLQFMNERSGVNPMVFASYFLGLQALGVICMASVSLVFARMMQARLFYPGACRQELLAFRGDRVGLVLLIVLAVAATQHNVLAISMLPMLVFYFFLAGFSLSFNRVTKQRPWILLAIFSVTLFVLPFVMLPIYVVIGALDVLFNFRSYLPSDAGNPV